MKLYVKTSQDLVSVYSQDLEFSLEDELIQFSKFIVLGQDEKKKKTNQMCYSCTVFLKIKN